MGQTKLRDEQMGFNTSTGHDHDGTNSKKVEYINITGAPQFETSASNIKADSTASVGSLSTIARADHVHPQEVIPISKGGTGETDGKSLLKNEGFNTINIDTVFDHNYVAVISGSSYGSNPNSNVHDSAIVVNFYTNHHVIQLAQQGIWSTTSHSAGSTWIRERHVNTETVWSNWKSL